MNTQEIVSIKKIPMQKLCDIGVDEVNEFVIDNGVVTHNSMYPKTIMGGGQGPMLAADTVLFVTKATDKDGKDIKGFNFTLSTQKSRFVREGLKLPLSVDFNTGIDKSSGLLELGIFLGVIEKKGHRYAPSIIDPETGEVTFEEDMLRFRKDIDIKWFNKIKNDPKYPFKEKLEEYFSLGTNDMIQGEEEELDDEDIDAMFSEEGE